MKNEESGMNTFEMNGRRTAVISDLISMVADQVAGCRETKVTGRERKSPRGMMEIEVKATYLYRLFFGSESRERWSVRKQW